MRLQHPTQRGAITVRSTRYSLDLEGCVEVIDPEHVAILKQVGFASRSSPAPAEQPESSDPLDSLNKDELIGKAEGLGLMVDRRMSKLKLMAAIRAAQGD